MVAIRNGRIPHTAGFFLGLIFLAAGLLGMVVLAVVGGRMKDVSPSPRQSDLI